MNILIVLAISAILATVYIYSLVRAETQRQKSQQEARLHNKKD